MAGMRFSREEVAKLAREIYEREIRDKVEAGNWGKYLVIDIGSPRA